MTQVRNGFLKLPITGRICRVLMIGRRADHTMRFFHHSALQG